MSQRIGCYFIPWGFLPKITRWVLVISTSILLLSDTYIQAYVLTARAQSILWFVQPGTNLPFAQADESARLLEPGKPIQRQLAGQETHFYEIALTSGQYLHVVVDQQGIDVVVRLFGPDETKIFEVDSPYGNQGPEDTYMVASMSGSHRLELQSLEKNAPSGKYEIRIEELRIATSSDRTRVAAEIICAEAALLGRDGSENAFLNAITKYQQALSLWRSINDRRSEGVTLANIGNLYSRMNKKHEALDYFKQSLSHLQETPDRQGQMIALTRISMLYNLFGEKQKALESYNRVLALAKALADLAWEAVTLSNTAVIYLDLGEAQRSLYLFEQALAIQQARNDRRGEAITRNNIARAYDYLGEKQKAIEFFNQALVLHQKMNNQVGQAAAYNNIGSVYYDLGDMQKAIESYNKALPAWRGLQNSMGESRTLNNLGKAYASLGEKQKALDYYNQALPLRRAIGDKNGEALTIYDIARLERDRGDLIKATSLAESALLIVESLRTNVVSRDLRASYLGSKQQYYQLYVDLLMRQHRLNPSAKYDSMALGVSERARARSLLEMLSEARTDIRRGVDPLLLANELRLRQQINAKATEQMTLLSGRHAKQQAESIAEELSILTSEHIQLEAEIRVKNPRYADLTFPRPLTVEEIQQQVLDSDTLLLEYALGDDHSYMWAVTPTSVTSVELPKRTEIEKMARRLYELLTARNHSVKFETTGEKRARVAQADADLPRAAFELSRMILGPVATQLGKKRLLIVADGELQYVPFGMLPIPGAITQTKNPAPFSDIESQSMFSVGFVPLLTDHEIVSLPSASTLAVLRRELAGRKPAPKTMAVLADPVFSTEDDRLKTLRSGKRIAKRNAQPQVERSQPESELKRYAGDSRAEDEILPRLIFTRREAEAIVALVPLAKLKQALDFQASRITATDPEMSQYRFLHFATHGFINNTHPQLSGLVLSLVDQEGKHQDGFLRAIDVFNLKLSADLVVLSGCRTGLGKEVRGEGLVGLTRSFMYAGAARVMVSLWDVNDKATAELMARFYSYMLGKRSLRPAAALRAAQLSIWKQTRGQSPYYWAAFVLNGELR